MENMDKGLTVPKWVLIVWPKIPQMPQNLSSQIVCLSSKFDFDGKKASVGVRSPCQLIFAVQCILHAVFVAYCADMTLQQY
jgi:hypothetical protein